MPTRRTRSASTSGRKRARRAAPVPVIDLDADEPAYPASSAEAGHTARAHDEPAPLPGDGKENAVAGLAGNAMPARPRGKARARARARIVVTDDDDEEEDDDEHLDGGDGDGYDVVGRDDADRALLDHGLYHPNADAAPGNTARAAAPPLPPHLQPALEPARAGAAHGPAAEITGREIVIRWVDGRWYDAVVVRYYAREDEHKLVYRNDDGVEVVCLRRREWRLLARRPQLPVSSPSHLVLHGAVIEFTYPHDGCRYQAMIYDHNERGDRVRIVYLDEHCTDSLKGGGWDIVSDSPCIEATPLDPDAAHHKAEAMLSAIRSGYPGSNKW